MSFSKPRKVIEQCGPASFILDDGKTWNLLSALATMTFSNILQGVNLRFMTIPLMRRRSLQHGSQRLPRQVFLQRDLCLVQTAIPGGQRVQPPDSFLLQKRFHARP
ncbi:hypothetical protein HPB52_000196 [Rhipicephalus sanguineus]|uniref:Uncharacterized protein n=1 Tax=Rhipicephalus sanguineus TaxID=34632 RepID=A0A9D4SX41_RHISA|nr:hypothetical protein HPB52_000196 [Rhipicephalus sanguineus]